MSAPLGRGNPPSPQDSIEVEIAEITKDIKGWCIPFQGNSYSHILEKVQNVSEQISQIPANQTPAILNKIEEVKSLLEDKKRGSILNSCSKIFSSIFNAVKGIGFISSQTQIKIELKKIQQEQEEESGRIDLLKKGGFNEIEIGNILSIVKNAPKYNREELFKGASYLKEKGFDAREIAGILRTVKNALFNLNELFKGASYLKENKFDENEISNILVIIKHSSPHNLKELFKGAVHLREGGYSGEDTARILTLLRSFPSDNLEKYFTGFVALRSEDLKTFSTEKRLSKYERIEEKRDWRDLKANLDKDMKFSSSPNSAKKKTQN